MSNFRISRSNACMTGAGGAWVCSVDAESRGKEANRGLASPFSFLLEVLKCEESNGKTSRGAAAAEESEPPLPPPAAAAAEETETLRVEERGTSL